MTLLLGNARLKIIAAVVVNASAFLGKAPKPTTQDRFSQDCTSRLDLAIDIKIPTASPSVTIAVPP